MPNNSNTIRVLHITASSMIGGGPEHVWQLVKNLPLNICSYIAAPDCKPYGERFSKAVGKERIITIPQRKFTLKAFLSVLTFIKKHKIDIIHSHGKGAGIYGRPLALLSGTKSVHTFHGIHLPHYRLKRTLYLVLERFLCQISRVCITVSPGEYACAKELQLAPQKLHTVINGIKIPAQDNFYYFSKPFIILHVSRFDPQQKNSLFVLEIAKKLQEIGSLPSCLFVLVGDGEQRKELEAKIERDCLQDYFNFMGEQLSVQPFWKNAGCLLSTSRWEGLPLAVLEAAAHGVPTIASDVVGNRDAIVHNKTGFLYPLQDASKAAQYIMKLMQQKNIWQDMRVQAYAHAQKHFNVQDMAQSTAHIYMNSIK